MTGEARHGRAGRADAWLQSPAAIRRTVEPGRRWAHRPLGAVPGHRVRRGRPSWLGTQGAARGRAWGA